MEQEQGTLWTPSTEHTNIQRGENGQQTQRQGHPNSTQLMDHYPRITNRADMLKRIVC
ncbi:PB1-F2 protein [Influenza A virus]|nr:PB1-F2 protein [Influenza A virus]UPP24280.1 PB1-F2 protein [Influenza A virus]UPP24292.1 PB1-F2 protein [Influenza A virus]